eukprot:9924905-Alexandrium_andersonii.AAC.1
MNCCCPVHSGHVWLPDHRTILNDFSSAGNNSARLRHARSILSDEACQTKWRLKSIESAEN